MNDLDSIQLNIKQLRTETQNNLVVIKEKLSSLEEEVKAVTKGLDVLKSETRFHIKKITDALSTFLTALWALRGRIENIEKEAGINIKSEGTQIQVSEKTLTQDLFTMAATQSSGTESQA